MGRSECQNLRLTSGYWKRDSLRLNRCSHELLAKDETSHRYHEAAVQMASLATQQILRRLVRTMVVKHGEAKADHLMTLFTNSSATPDAQYCPSSQASAVNQCPAPDTGTDSSTSNLETSVQRIMTRLFDREWPSDMTVP